MTLTIGSPKLRELTRTQLQSLAKREVVRAVGKTEDIIRRLVRKYPRGVPVSEDANSLSASSAPPNRTVLRKSHHKGTLSPSPVPETSGSRTDPRDEGQPITEAGSPSSSSDALEQLLYPEDDPVAGPSNANLSVPCLKVNELDDLPDHPTTQPILPSEHPSHGVNDKDEDARSSAPPPNAPNHDRQVDEEPDNDIDYPKGAPNHYMVVDTLRQFTNLVNAMPSMKTRIAESQRLLQRTEALLEKATPDARELAVTREYLETFLLAKMKKKRELWDGTGKMEKKTRKLRMEWLRAERRAENEKRWKEANELNKQHGFKPEPFSAFASESDEDIIESLKTTPGSSRSGSSKRSRDESVDAESDGDAEEESHRKRTRS